MRPRNPIALLALVFPLLLAGLAAPAAVAQEDADELHRNIYEMRMRLEQDRAESESDARYNTLPYVMDAVDSGGAVLGGSAGGDPFARAREQLGSQIEQNNTYVDVNNDNRDCGDLQISGVEGNINVICGGNYGRASNESNSNVTENTTNVILPPNDNPNPNANDDEPAGEAPVADEEGTQ